MKKRDRILSMVYKEAKEDFSEFRKDIRRNPWKALGYLILAFLLIYITTGLFSDKKVDNSINQNAVGTTGDVNQTINVNREAKYTVYDSDEWKKTLRKREEGDYVAHMTFLATDGILPNIFCFHYATDVEVKSVIPDQYGMVGKGEGNEVCIPSPFQRQGFNFYFFQEPDNLTVY